MINLHDSSLLEKQLHRDLNIIIQHTKIRQQQYQKLLSTNQHITNLIQSIHSYPAAVIIDSVRNFTHILQSINIEHSTLKIQEIEISNKYKGISINNQSILKLMLRVASRILEMLQYYQQVKPNHIQHQYQNIKTTLIKNINQKDKIDIFEFNHITIQYLHHKLNQQITNLSNFINILQIGQPHQIHQNYSKYLKNIQTNKSNLSQSINRSPPILTKLQHPSNQSNQKILKNKNKILNLVVNGLYSTMELSKNHLIQGILCCNPKEKTQKLYQQIYSRNKLNHQQIMAFQAKSQRFNQKINKFKQLMQTESKKIQQAIIIKKIPKKQILLPTIDHNIPLLEITQVHQKVQITISDEDQHPPIQVLSVRVMGQKKKSNNINKKIIDEITQIRQNILKKNIQSKSKQSSKFYSMQATQQTFKHIKFDERQQQIYLRSNRARLPQIKNSCGCTMQPIRKNTNNDQRINIATHININGQSQKPRFSTKIQNFIQKNQSKQKKKDSLPKSFQYTFYVKKRTNRFYETGNNFII